MPRPIRFGVLVPSSNTSLEPLTSSMIATVPNITVHYSRFPVTEIALSDRALAQFDDTKILAAAALLADAEVDVIGWSGTSAGWLGLEADRRLCRQIKASTGIDATTSVLGLCKILDILTPQEESNAFGLVTPYLDEVQAAIIRTFADEGFAAVAESHLGRSRNLDFGEVDEETLDRQMEHVMGQIQSLDGPVKMPVVSTFCTNLRAAQRAEYWEKKYPGLVVADTVSTVLWDMLRIVGLDTRVVRNWGKIFELVSSNQ